MDDDQASDLSVEVLRHREVEVVEGHVDQEDGVAETVHDAVGGEDPANL